MEGTQAIHTTLINLNSFPAKLWYLVNNTQTQSINWDSKGKGILIDQPLFEAELLSPSQKLVDKSTYFFKTVNFQSFVRQLNLYGFKKVFQGQNHSEMQIDKDFITSRVHHFHNPNFIQGHPELLVNLKRLTSINKAKLKAGLEVKGRPPNRLHRRLLNSPGNNSEVKQNVLQVKEWERLPMPSQAWKTGTSNASYIPIYADKGIPAPMLHHYPTDSPYAGPFSASTLDMHDSHSSLAPGKFGSFLPSPSPYRYLSVCPPSSLDSNIACNHHSAASYPVYGYYPCFPVSYFHPSGHHPDVPASDTAESKNNDVNLNTVFKMTDEFQVSPPMHMVAVATPEEHLNTSTFGSFTSCATASILYNVQASTSNSSLARSWAQPVGFRSSVPGNVPSALTSRHAQIGTDSGLKQEPKQ